MKGSNYQVGLALKGKGHHFPKAPTKNPSFSSQVVLKNEQSQVKKQLIESIRSIILCPCTAIQRVSIPFQFPQWFAVFVLKCPDSKNSPKKCSTTWTIQTGTADSKSFFWWPKTCGRWSQGNELPPKWHKSLISSIVLEMFYHCFYSVTSL